MEKMILIILMVLTMTGTVWSADTNRDRRDQALRMYQEGLFQEMGTGDHEQALTIYTDIAKKYAGIPDIAAVAYYHIGMLLYKSGEHKSACRYFKLVLQKYPEQKSVIKRINIKLKELVNSKNTVETHKKKSGKKINSVPKSVKKQPVVIKDKQVVKKLPSQSVPIKATPSLGVGLNTVGAHLRCCFGKNDELSGEVNVGYDSETVSIGGRVMLVNRLKLKNINLSLYPGISLDVLLNRPESEKPVIGGFFGAAWKLTEYWELSSDIGYYYSQNNEQNVDTATMMKAYVTYYFQGPGNSVLIRKETGRKLY